MNIALIGASGNAGSRILAELIRRGHTVTAIVRNPEKVTTGSNVTARKADAFDKAGLSALLRGHEAVISAIHFTASDPEVLIAAVRESGVSRYLVIGGAGSLEVGPGVALVDTPDFPVVYKEEAIRGGVFLDRLRREDDLQWTFLSPSAVFEAGERTGIFRLGGDQLLVGHHGSRISFEDYAVALVDELEQPRHIRQRFTVGY